MPESVQLLICLAVENQRPGDPEDLFIGILSGTSIDAIDAALVRFAPKPELVASHTLPFPAEVRTLLRALCTPGEDEIDFLGRVDVRTGRVFADAVKGLLAKAGVPAGKIRAIGSHGQTIRHRPLMQPPFTLQIGDPNVIAANTGIPVVADFRRKDMALGGQGAPLVPAFHESVFRRRGQDRAVVNIGGIANVTILPGDLSQPILGFDTGPGNTLLDAWCRHTFGQPRDQDGAIAARGEIVPELLQALLTDPYFKQTPPKSTGPEYFSLSWLQQRLFGFERVSPPDVQATLVALTAHSIAAAVRAPAGKSQPEVFLCGGGVKNPVLMQRLREQLPESSVQLTDPLGVPTGWVEAMAFAWLARQHVLGLPGNCPSVTGASRAAVLGGWFPA